MKYFAGSDGKLGSHSCRAISRGRPRAFQVELKISGGISRGKSTNIQSGITKWKIYNHTKWNYKVENLESYKVE